MWFGLLGPLQMDTGSAAVAGDVRTVPAPRQRALLAALLTRANRVVPASELADLIWDGAPPAGATALRTQVMRLRRTLGEEAAARITTRDPGYLMTVSEQELDSARFAALYLQAGVLLRDGQWSRTAVVVGEALGLWRGDPLLDVDCRMLREQCAPHLEELHGQLLEWQADADIHLGRYQQAVLVLRHLVQRHPLREHAHALLMLALYRYGRQAEALDAYRTARRVLVDELGAEPGTQLRNLHSAILAGSPVLLAPPLDRAPARGGTPRTSHR